MSQNAKGRTSKDPNQNVGWKDPMIPSWEKSLSPNPHSVGPHLQKRHYLVDIFVLTIG